MRLEKEAVDTAVASVRVSTGGSHTDVGVVPSPMPMVFNVVACTRISGRTASHQVLNDIIWRAGHSGRQASSMDSVDKMKNGRMV